VTADASGMRALRVLPAIIYGCGIFYGGVIDVGRLPETPGIPTDKLLHALVFLVFEITPADVGDAEYADLFEGGLDEVAAGGLGLQWSVEVEARDAQGRVLGTTTLQSTCGTRGGEAVEHYGRFFVYDGEPVFTADEVAEVVVDPATLEVLPLVLSPIDEDSCSGILTEARS
jgi:hypothetical protein